jgi:hypothetical protein
MFQYEDTLRDRLNVHLGNRLEIVSYASALLRQFNYQGFKDFNP